MFIGKHKKKLIMRTLSVILYVAGSALLIASCFTSSVALTWWFGIVAVALLIVGCVMQFNLKRTPDVARHDRY